jgi:hypothetical protein
MYINTFERGTDARVVTADFNISLELEPDGSGDLSGYMRTYGLSRTQQHLSTPVTLMPGTYTYNDGLGTKSFEIKKAVHLYLDPVEAPPVPNVGSMHTQYEQGKLAPADGYTDTEIKGYGHVISIIRTPIAETAQQQPKPLPHKTHRQDATQPTASPAGDKPEQK